jgi:uncharacterized protein involved in exopolysaccharide biosynthesis
VSTSDVDQAEMTLAEVVAILARSRWLIISIAAAVTLAAAIAAWTLPKSYEASVLVIPITEDSGAGRLGALGATLSQLGNIASLAGIAGPANGMRAESLATLQSEALTERYIDSQKLLPVLFSRLWDPMNKRWKTDDPRKIPTLWKGNALFKSNIRSVSENPKTGLVTISIAWRDPRLAAQWANDLVRVTNETLRDKAIAESERNISYLNGQVSNTNVVELRNALYMLMEAEIKKEMLARGSESYALKVIDPAVAPERQSSPRPVLLIILGALGGVAMAIVGVLSRERLRVAFLQS